MDEKQVGDHLSLFIKKKERAVNLEFARLTKNESSRKGVVHHDFSEEEEWKIEIVKENKLEDFILNSIKINIKSDNFVEQWAAMDANMNRLYGDLRKFQVKDKRPKIRVGMLLAVLDRRRDNTGRFKRAKVISTNRVGTTHKIIKCQFLDENSTVNFDTKEEKDQFYRLLSKFLYVPPRCVDVRLAYLDAFEGCPKFGKLFSNLVRNSDWKIKMVKEGTDHPEFIFISDKSKMSLNEYLVNKLCAFDSWRSTGLVAPQSGTIWGMATLGCVKESGIICLRLQNRAQVLLDGILEKLNKNFSLTTTKTGSSKPKIHQLCLAQDPGDGRLFRCEPVAPANEKTSTVRVLEWEDGSERIIDLSSLIPLDAVKNEELLSLMKNLLPQAIPCQLANVDEVKDFTKFYSIFPKDRIVGVRIAGTTFGTGELPCVDLFTHKIGGYSIGSPQLHVYNDELIKLKIAHQDSKDFKQFPSQKRVQETSLCLVNMELSVIDWMTNSPTRQSDDFVLGSKVKIQICVSQIESATKFVIHPWRMLRLKEKMDQDLKKQMNLPWIKPEEYLSTIEIGDFCVYKEERDNSTKRPKFFRAKMTRRLVDTKRIELLLIDYARYIEVEGSSLRRLPPTFALLGPQAVIGIWHYALKKEKGKEAELTDQLEKIVKTGRQVEAYVVTLRYDHHNRAQMELIFDCDAEFPKD